MRTNECVYCQDIKQVKVWEKTGELVCMECRLDLLATEFAEAGYTPEEIDATMLKVYFS